MANRTWKGYEPSLSHWLEQETCDTWPAMSGEVLRAQRRYQSRH